MADSATRHLRRLTPRAADEIASFPFVLHESHRILPRIAQIQRRGCG
ncbi:MAG: hypothetical protein MI923_11245 [Phycisphaerales bacterium]|nr:hypothetical protein [Phycisphaerales bacterium]